MAKLEHILWSFLIFSVFIVSGVFIVGDINLNYGTDIETDEFNDTYNTVSEMYDLSDDMRETVIEAKIDGTDATESTITASFNAIRLAKDTFGLFGDILNDFARVVGLPAFIIKFAIAAYTILIVALIIFIFLRLRN